MTSRISFVCACCLTHVCFAATLARLVNKIVVVIVVVAHRLREDRENGTWFFNEAELEKALKGATVFLFNSPHNPTGKVFSVDELQTIARLCIKHGV